MGLNSIYRALVLATLVLETSHIGNLLEEIFIGFFPSLPCLNVLPLPSGIFWDPQPNIVLLLISLSQSLLLG